MIKRKYVLKLTRRSLTGLTLVIIFGALWMFVLGIFVGRSSVPVEFSGKNIKEKLAFLKSENDKEIKATVNNKEIDSRQKLGFYEDLKKNKNIAKNVFEKNEAEKKEEREKVNKQGENNKKRLTIQVASVKEEKTAMDMIAELKRHGYPAYMTRVNIPELGLWFRVRVGHYSSKQQADAAIEGLKKRNFSPILLQE